MISTVQITSFPLLSFDSPRFPLSFPRRRESIDHVILKSSAWVIETIPIGVENINR